MTDLARLNAQLTEGDILTRADAAEQLARHRTAADTDFIITVYDKLWTAIGTIGDDLIELSGDDPKNDLGA